MCAAYIAFAHIRARVLLPAVLLPYPLYLYGLEKCRGSIFSRGESRREDLGDLFVDCIRIRFAR
jgi:hypothetical protein